MSDFPAVAPTLNLDFANSKQLDPRITFRRSSTGTYVDADGLIKTAGIDTPRFDHDPVTGVCKGLLVEEQRTNDFTNFAGFFGCTFTANAAIAPDGSYTAARVDSNSNAVFRINYNIVAGTSYTVSLYVKSIYSAARYFRLQFSTAGSSGEIYGLKDTPISSDSWTRCVLTGTAMVTGTIRIEFGANFTFNNGDSILIWGTQVEAGAFPTSYIPTAGAAVTRSADLASITGTNFTNFYRSDQGTVYVQSSTGQGIYSCLLEFRSANPPDCPQLLSRYSGDKCSLQVPKNGNYTNRAVTLDYSSQTLNKYIGVYQDANSRIGVNGSLSAIITGTIGTGGNALVLGRSRLNADFHNGTISRIAYWPKRLPDAQLQALTRR